MLLQRLEERVDELEDGVASQPKGPEPILTCVQCLADYKESENAGISVKRCLRVVHFFAKLASQLTAFSLEAAEKKYMCSSTVLVHIRGLCPYMEMSHFLTKIPAFCHRLKPLCGLRFLFLVGPTCHKNYRPLKVDGKGWSQHDHQVDCILISTLC